ncbi:hypothetical protein F4780DRAFT_4335 [Xylariomycetidae sp. FL0641]|nr:hypothetical protein F4780DRAFT_4335 [Xylariomycetidae sp. FL0641]
MPVENIALRRLDFFFPFFFFFFLPSMVASWLPDLPCHPILRTTLVQRGDRPDWALRRSNRPSSRRPSGRRLRKQPGVASFFVAMLHDDFRWRQKSNRDSSGMAGISTILSVRS